jgi:hypothetical protein
MTNGTEKRNRWAVVVLFLLASALAEMLTGSAPPVEFLSPAAFIIMAALYGSGAILIRELRVRWKKGYWPTVFILGAAYGIIEEGLACKSFFNPAWQDLGILGTYGRWAGVNWVWSLNLTVFHAVISITIPIFIVELLFPEQREARWLGRLGMTAFWLLLLAVTVFGFLAFPYYPSFLHVMPTIGVVVALFLLARLLPAPQPAPKQSWLLWPICFTVVGFWITVFFFVTHLILPELGLPVWLTITATILWLLATVWVVRTLSRGGRWNDKHKLALLTGPLLFWILLAPLQEMDPKRLDDTTGLTVVAFLILLFLIWLRGKVRISVTADRDREHLYDVSAEKNQCLSQD